MRWFGESWGAPVCEEADKAKTPVGDKCAKCDKAIKKVDQGLLIPYLDMSSKCGNRAWDKPWHLDCFLESIGVRSAASEG